MKPILQLYRGYANEQELIVMGHVFRRTYEYDFQKKNLKNARSIINQFRIKTIQNFDVYLKFGEKFRPKWPALVVVEKMCRHLHQSRRRKIQSEEAFLLVYFFPSQASLGG